VCDFQFIAHIAAQVRLGPGNLPPMHEGYFLALAERNKPAYLGKLPETVPFAPGFAPIQLVSEASERIFHRDESMHKTS
jgi:hypothetical protein